MRLFGTTCDATVPANHSSSQDRYRGGTAPSLGGWDDGTATLPKVSACAQWAAWTRWGPAEESARDLLGRGGALGGHAPAHPEAPSQTHGRRVSRADREAVSPRSERLLSLVPAAGLRGGLESLGGRDGERSMATRLHRQLRRAGGRGRRSVPVGGGHLGGEDGAHPGLRGGREWQPCQPHPALLGERDRPAPRQLRGADDRPSRGGGSLVPPSDGADGLQRGRDLA